MTNAPALTVTVDRLDKNLKDAEERLLKKGELSDGHAARLMLFRERTDALKHSLAADDLYEEEEPVEDTTRLAQAKNLEEAFEAWVDEIDQEFNTPTKRNQSASM